MTRDELILDNLRLATHTARRFSPCAIAFEDLIQLATLHLVRAASTFDPSRGVPFAAYARRVMTWGIIDAIREEKKNALTVPMEDGFDRVSADPRARAGAVDAAIDIAALRRQLDTRSSRVLDLRFMRGDRLREIGEAEGVNASRAGQIVNRAVALMRRAVQPRTAGRCTGPSELPKAA